MFHVSLLSAATINKEAGSRVCVHKNTQTVGRWDLCTAAGWTMNLQEPIST